MQKIFVSLCCLFLVACAIQHIYAHCQIPCGIYDDEMRIKMMNEHITTIEKSMKMIADLSKENPLNYNQIVRWVQNKEDHADELSQIVSFYFLTQRIQVVDDAGSAEHTAYVNKLKLLHEMMVYAMKAKQSVDLAHVEKLRSLLSSFKKAYFGIIEEGKK